MDNPSNATPVARETVATKVAKAAKRRAKQQRKNNGSANQRSAFAQEEVLTRLLTDAGIDMQREVSDLEFMFMAPQLAKLVLFPDTSCPRAIALLKQEIPLTLQSGRISGSANRSLRQAFLIKGAAAARSWALPAWLNSAFNGGSTIWNPASASDPPVGQQTFGSFSLASPNGITLVPVTIGQTTSRSGDRQDVLVPVQFDFGGSSYHCLPVTAGDTVAITASTSNNDANRFTIGATFVIDTGGTLSTQTETSAALTGSGSSVAATIVAPTNAVGLFTYNITNTIATSAVGTVRPAINVVLGTTATGDVAYPAGGSEQMTNIMAVSDKARITAQSLWLRNDTPELYRQGEVAGYQLRDQEEVFPPLTVEALGAVNYAYNGQLAKGMYGFLVPWASGYGQTSISLPWEDIDGHDSINNVDEGDQMLFALKVNPAATEQAIVAILYSVVEYKTTNSFIQVTIGRCDILAIEMTCNMLRQIPNIMENDSHWKRIAAALKGKVGNVFSAVLRTVKDDIAPVAGPALLKAAMAAAAL